MSDVPLHLDTTDRALIKATQAGLPLAEPPLRNRCRALGLERA